jgi:undecaprenyl-diphosphatase
LSLECLRRLDKDASDRLRSLPLNRLWRALLAAAAHSADSAVVIPLFALLWILGRFSLSSSVLSFAAAYAASVVVTSALKYAFRRTRPAGEWGAVYRRTDPHSFPSGHASRTLALTLVAAGRGWAALGMGLAAWSLLVGFSRIVLGVHYLLDVLVGYLLGALVGAAVWVLLDQGILP